MIALEMIALVVLVILALRMRPPERGVSPRILSLLAGIATVSFGIAMGAIVIVVSDVVFGVALLVAGITGCTFLWLARGGYEDDDDEGDEPPADPPGADPDGGQRRFLRKRTRAAGRPTRSPGGVR
ncbi:MAG: hypothetical protein ACKOSO_08040 [Actinomycetota bacterium]